MKEGNIEKWCKFTEQEIVKYNLFKFINQKLWVCVSKKRAQKIDKDVNIELTCLRIYSKYWWSLAFEMTTNNNIQQQRHYFFEVVNRASKTYYGPKLSAANSYSYSRWLFDLGSSVPTVLNY